MHIPMHILENLQYYIHIGFYPLFILHKPIILKYICKIKILKMLKILYGDFRALWIKLKIPRLGDLGYFAKL